MKNIDRWFILTGLVFLLVGIALGIKMAKTMDFTLHGLHAHLNLLGFVVMTLYGLFYRQWPRMQEGMLADIVVFDPETVTDNSTYEVAWKPTTGMAAVIVNGTVVVREDQVLPVYPGQPVRFDPTEPKFKPVSPDQWGERFMVGLELPGEGCMPHPDTHPAHFDRPAKN